MLNVISKSFSATCFYGKTAGKSGIGKRIVFQGAWCPSQYNATTHGKLELEGYIGHTACDDKTLMIKMLFFSVGVFDLFQLVFLTYFSLFRHQSATFIMLANLRIRFEPSFKKMRDVSSLVFLNCFPTYIIFSSKSIFMVCKP